MIFAMFDTPFYAWPTTAAFIAVIGAFLVARYSFSLNRRLKLLDAMRDVRQKLCDFSHSMSLACLPCPDLGARLEQIGGWDEFCRLMNQLRGSLKLLELYGNKQTAQAAENISEKMFDLYRKTHNSVINLQHSNHVPRPEVDDAIRFITGSTRFEVF